MPTTGKPAMMVAWLEKTNDSESGTVIQSLADPQGIVAVKSLMCNIFLCLLPFLVSGKLAFHIKVWLNSSWCPAPLEVLFTPRNYNCGGGTLLGQCFGVNRDCQSRD